MVASFSRAVGAGAKAVTGSPPSHAGPVEVVSPQHADAPTAPGVTITIDVAGVTAINSASQYVTLATTVTTYVSTSGLAQAATSLAQAATSVAWYVTKAAQNLVLTWSTSYSLFETSSPVKVGSLVLPNALQTPTTRGFLYSFGKDNLFVQGSQLDSKNQYAVANKSGKTLNFGLALGLNAQGNPTPCIPLVIVSVLNNETAYFTPTNSLYVFLQNHQRCGTIIQGIPAQACHVLLTAASLTAKLTFNDASNTFYPTS